MKVIGITGPSGSGKTTISKIFKENYNAFIIDADQVARNLSNNTETEYFKEMVKLFGTKAVREDGHLNRKKVAEIIYKDKAKRRALNKLTFKYVVKDITDKLKSIEKDNYDYVGIDVPLLYEAKMENICDYVIAIVAETQEKIRRICIRDNISEELAMQRLKIQNDNEFFTKKADFVIHNDGTLEKLGNSLKEIIEKIWINGCQK